MRAIAARVPRGLGSLLLGAVACGFAGALVARYALVGFPATSHRAAAVAVLAGLTVAGFGWLRRGIRQVWNGSLGPVG